MLSFKECRKWSVCIAQLEGQRFRLQEEEEYFPKGKCRLYVLSIVPRWGSDPDSLPEGRV